MGEDEVEDQRHRDSDGRKEFLLGQNKVRDVNPVGFRGEGCQDGRVFDAVVALDEDRVNLERCELEFRSAVSGIRSNREGLIDGKVLQDTGALAEVVANHLWGFQIKNQCE